MNVVYTHLIQHTRSNIFTPFIILFAYKYKSIPQDGTFLLATCTIINTYPLKCSQMFTTFNFSVDLKHLKKQDLLQTVFVFDVY